MLPGAVLPRLSASGKRQVLQAMAEALAGAAGVDSRAIFDAVLLRERLAGTGMGEGVAIPHARVETISRPIAAFARLDPPIDFDALDGRPADLVFMLAAPADRGGDHLKALARASRVLRRPESRARLRAARGVDEIVLVLCEAAPLSV